MSETIGYKIAMAFTGKSDDPLHPDNKTNEDFLRGFDVGQRLPKGDSALFIIHKEWEKIGSPEVLPQSFRDFKRGLWAGCFRDNRLFTP